MLEIARLEGLLLDELLKSADGVFEGLGVSLGVELGRGEVGLGGLEGRVPFAESGDELVFGFGLVLELLFFPPAAVEQVFQPLNLALVLACVHKYYKQSAIIKSVCTNRELNESAQISKTLIFSNPI